MSVLPARARHAGAPVLEGQWRAIVDCDPASDGAFLYAVVTTGIVCRPSCRSRTPKRANVRVFASVRDALAAGFRPCKRCRPDRSLWPEEELVRRVQHYVREHYAERLSLQRVAAVVSVSPHHLHRVFGHVVGTTWGHYLLQTRLAAAKERLRASLIPVGEVALGVGFSSAAHFATVFRRHTGLRPTEFRAMARGAAERTGFRAIAGGASERRGPTPPHNRRGPTPPRVCPAPATAGGPPAQPPQRLP